MKKLISLTLCIVMLCSCTPPPASSMGNEMPSIEDAEPEHMIETEIEPEEQTEADAHAFSVVQTLAKDIVDTLSVNASMGEPAIRIVYEYLIETVYLADPVGLDVWRYMSDEPNIPIPFIENRALSPFLFQIGSCEDFAAAMVLLLRAAGFNADYVAGFTVSIQGPFVDHAWAVVELDSRWYHVDPQLEQNVTKSEVKYRYYLKSDDMMLADHRWGENLISFWNMPEEEKQNIQENHMPPICPESYPVPSAKLISLPEKPDFAQVHDRIEKLKNTDNGKSLQKITLNVEPPILVAQHHITPPLIVD